jgi:predicted Zn-dependent protease
MALRRLLLLLLAASLLTFGADKKASLQTQVKVQKSPISIAQEVQPGKEAAASVERQIEVVKNPEIEAWLARPV